MFPGNYSKLSLCDSQVTKGALHHQIADLKKKIKQTLADANSCDVEMRELKAQQQQFGADLDERQVIRTIMIIMSLIRIDLHI
jgi:hypothetical protein